MKTLLEQKCPKVSDPKTYYKIHNYFSRHQKADHCSVDITHVSKRYEWALIADEYSLDINDYAQLCLSCHRKLDYTDYCREQTRLRATGVPNARRQPVLAKDEKNKVTYYFPYISEAAKHFKVARTAISNNLSGLTKSSGGVVWSRYEGVPLW